MMRIVTIIVLSGGLAFGIGSARATSADPQLLTDVQTAVAALTPANSDKKPSILPVGDHVVVTIPTGAAAPKPQTIAFIVRRRRDQGLIAETTLPTDGSMVTMNKNHLMIGWSVAAQGIDHIEFGSGEIESGAPARPMQLLHPLLKFDALSPDLSQGRVSFTLQRAATLPSNAPTSAPPDKSTTNDVALSIRYESVPAKPLSLLWKPQTPGSETPADLWPQTVALLKQFHSIYHLERLQFTHNGVTFHLAGQLQFLPEAVFGAASDFTLSVTGANLPPNPLELGKPEDIAKQLPSQPTLAMYLVKRGISPDGKPTLTYHLTVGADGSLCLNGTDISSVKPSLLALGVMLQTQVAAQAAATTKSAVTATPKP